jgi:hypothetical protein
MTLPSIYCKAVAGREAAARDEAERGLRVLLDAVTRAEEGSRTVRWGDGERRAVPANLWRAVVAAAKALSQ